MKYMLLVRKERNTAVSANDLEHSGFAIVRYNSSQEFLKRLVRQRGRLTREEVNEPIPELLREYIEVVTAWVRKHRATREWCHA